MIKEIVEKKEKKVEYIELIYDLIFVYIIGRNNTLLHGISNGFVETGMFMAYVMCTLAVIQIWTFTTYYINLYGKNSIRNHIFLFLNMFLLYFIGESTRGDWQEYHNQYHIAWALILINIAVQYLLKFRDKNLQSEYKKRVVRMAAILIVEAVLVLLSMLEFAKFETTYLSLAAILFGVISVSISSKISNTSLVDFNHLSERIMLYVVFTFGEMIIAIATYFEGSFNLNSLYFCMMAFLIVVGLFLSYGIVYDYLIDREKKTQAIGYVIIHIFIIFSMNNITAALEFMREEEIALLPKMIFLVFSILLFYIFLFLTSIYSKITCKADAKFYIGMTVSAVIFTGLMILLREHMMINIAITVLFVFAVYGVLYKFSKRIKDNN